MKLKECLKRGICLTLASVLLLTGCGSTEVINEDVTPVSQVEEETEFAETTFSEGENELVASLKAKYGAAAVDYSKEIINLDRDQALQFEFGFDSLGYQSVEGVLEAIGIDKENLCTYCWDGKE